MNRSSSGPIPRPERGQAGDWTLVGIDSGGTATRVLVRQADGTTRSHRLPSGNPASVPDPSAVWNDVFTVVSNAGTAPVRAWIGSASVSLDTLAHESERIRDAGERVIGDGRAVVTNDVVPLLLGPPLNGVGTIASIGTGTSFVARTADGDVRRASGYEYVISDEGGAWDIGHLGLRAAAQAFDGRGPSTVLLAAATRRFDNEIPALGRELANRPRSKMEVASFARDVCRAAAEGDPVALDVIDIAVSHVAGGLRAVREQSGIAASTPIVLSGGVTTCQPFRTRLESRLAREREPSEVLLIADGTSAALALAQQTVCLGPEEIVEHTSPFATRVISFA